MGNARRLPDNDRQRLDRLMRDNWRTQVSTAPVIPAAAVPESPPEPGAEVSWVEVLARLDAVEQRMDNLEGVEESG